LRQEEEDKRDFLAAEQNKAEKQIELMAKQVEADDKKKMMM
jgi:hypothetical protein